MAWFRGTHPMRSVEIGSGSFSLRETHGLILICFSFIQTNPFAILVKILYKIVTLNVYPLHPMGTYVIIVKEGQR